MARLAWSMVQLVHSPAKIICIRARLGVHVRRKAIGLGRTEEWTPQILLHFGSTGRIPAGGITIHSGHPTCIPALRIDGFALLLLFQKLVAIHLWCERLMALLGVRIAMNLDALSTSLFSRSLTLAILVTFQSQGCLQSVILAFS